MAVIAPVQFAQKGGETFCRYSQATHSLAQWSYHWHQPYQHLVLLHQSINGSQRLLEFPENEGMENDSMPFQIANCYFHFMDVRLRLKEPE